MASKRVCAKTFEVVAGRSTAITSAAVMAETRILRGYLAKLCRIGKRMPESLRILGLPMLILHA
jgi:hypothetical protein